MGARASINRTTGIILSVAALLGAIALLLANVPPLRDRARSAYCAVWASCEFHWMPAGRQDDCSVPPRTLVTIDFPGHSIPPPGQLKPDDRECFKDRLHLAAVCWDKVRDFEPPQKELADAVKGKPYCLYKRVPVADCSGGLHRSDMFECVQTPQ
jgi:hypothetical protein